jgi:hypothetical protein
LRIEISLVLSVHKGNGYEEKYYEI